MDEGQLAERAGGDVWGWRGSVSRARHLRPHGYLASTADTRDILLRRPGILVLVNDTDWELEGELDYRLEDGDEVVFISTLHGG
jgi:hypothetical protein